MFTRRTFLTTSAAGAGAVSILPFMARAEGHSGADSFETDGGSITVHPVAHASFVMETPGGVIYVDPVGDPAAYDGFPQADLILITHQHGDHYNEETLTALTAQDTAIVVNPAVYDMLPDALRSAATAIANGESTKFGTIGIDAIPAYNMTEGRLQYHPQGRDNGYVLGIDGRRIYIAGDTEDIPEMRALQNIDIAFVPMLLPYTMSVEAAASAVAEFHPSYVYPYHYRDADIEQFAQLVSEATDETDVLIGGWYA